MLILLLIVIYVLGMWLFIRLQARRTAKKIWQEALTDKSGRKMRAIEKWLKDGPPSF